MLRVGRVVRSNGRIDALLKISWPRISISWHSPCCSLACFHFLGLSSAFVFFFIAFCDIKITLVSIRFFCVFEFVGTTAWIIFVLWLSSYPVTHEIEAGLQKPLNIHTQWEVVPKSLLHSHIAEVVKKTIIATIEMDFRVNLNSLKRNMLFWFGSTFPLGACILERFCSGSIGGWELFKSPWKEGVHTQRLFESVENIPISLTSSLLIPAAPWYDSLD